MKPIVTFAALLWSLLSALSPPADEPDRSGGAPVQAALDKLVRAATGTDWPSESAARKELASLGPEAVPKVAEAAHSHGADRVRRACYKVSPTRLRRTSGRSTRWSGTAWTTETPGSATTAPFFWAT